MTCVKDLVHCLTHQGSIKHHEFGYCGCSYTKNVIGTQRAIELKRM